jgi:hypothetical protein
MLSSSYIEDASATKSQPHFIGMYFLRSCQRWQQYLDGAVGRLLDDGGFGLVLNEEADRRNEESGGGPKWTRADVIRVIINDWMKAR